MNCKSAQTAQAASRILLARQLTARTRRRNTTALRLQPLARFFAVSGLFAASGLLPPLPYFLLRLFLRRRERKVKGILKSLWPTRLYTARTRRRNTTALRFQPLARFFAASRLLCGFRPLAALPYFLLRPLLRRRERESERNFLKRLMEQVADSRTHAAEFSEDFFSVNSFAGRKKTARKVSRAAADKISACVKSIRKCAFLSLSGTSRNAEMSYFNERRAGTKCAC